MPAHVLMRDHPVQLSPSMPSGSWIVPLESESVTWRSLVEFLDDVPGHIARNPTTAQTLRANPRALRNVSSASKRSRAGDTDGSATRHFTLAGRDAHDLVAQPPVLPEK